MLYKIPLTEEEIYRIKDIIEKKDDCKIEIRKSSSTIWFVGNNRETELRINFLGNLKIIISRVRFHNKRQGTMEMILKLLENYGKKYQIQKLCIQSVMTKEMSNFCNKWHIKPDPYASFQLENFIMGDYYEMLE